MAVSVFLALTLLETFASADTCEDNPDWRFKGNEEHDCEWIAAKESRKEKKCRKNAVQRNCRKSCDLCEQGFLCPGKLNSRKFDDDCDDYQPGLECGYDHVWTGCNNGDMACTPTKVYTCSAQEADGSTMDWNVEDVDDEICELYEDGSLYGEPCHPNDCPTDEPVEGSSCTWYEGENMCRYDHRWLGCDFDDLTCRSTREYECDRATLTWTLEIVRNGPNCPFRPDPGLPRGESCNTEDPQPTPPLDGAYQCPDEPPTTDTCSKTGRTPDEGCFYNYVVMGCTPETIRCDAVEHFTCYYDGGPWVVLLNSIEDCGVDGVTTGVPCDPENFDPTEYFEEEEEFTCPSIPPRLDSPCDEEEVPYSGCEYYFVVTGCDYDSLSCSSTYVSTCEDRGVDVESFYTWQAIILDPLPCDQIEGVPEDWPDGQGCDPENFDKDELLESLSPDDSNDEKPSDDSTDGTPPRDPPKEYECPADVPTQGDDCTDDTYDPDGCEYDHLVTGCTFDELVCEATTVATCDDDRPPVVITDENGDQYVHRFLGWNVANSGMEGCPDAEDGWPDGESCDPETFDRTDYLDRFGGDSGLVCPEEVPEFGDICDGPGTCEYEHKVYGCTTEELFCAPATWADCVHADVPVKDGESYETKPGFRFIIGLKAYIECEDVPEDWPEGTACDPETFDPRALLAENENELQLRW